MSVEKAYLVLVLKRPWLYTKSKPLVQVRIFRLHIACLFQGLYYSVVFSCEDVFERSWIGWLFWKLLHHPAQYRRKLKVNTEGYVSGKYIQVFFKIQPTYQHKLWLWELEQLWPYISCSWPPRTSPVLGVIRGRHPSLWFPYNFECCKKITIFKLVMGTENECAGYYYEAWILNTLAWFRC